LGSSSSSSRSDDGSNSYDGSNDGEDESVSTYSISIGAIRRASGRCVIIETKCVDTK
jgi:hypothetical protein